LTYLDQLRNELARVGIRGGQRARILAEAADHIAEGGAEEFGDPKELAQLFADELATQETTRAAYFAFAALALAGAGFGLGWHQLVLRSHGGADITSAAFVPVGIVAAFALIACPQISFAAGLLSIVRARRLRKLRVAPAAELELLARRTRTALGFGAASTFAFSVFAVDYHSTYPGWEVLVAGLGGLALTLPLAAAAAYGRRAAAVQSAAPGEAGDMFDDFPVRLPRRPWLVCFGLTAVLAILFLGAAWPDEGPRNAVAESVLVIGSFAALGRRLGLRR
jgi:hypothetical protein